MSSLTCQCKKTVMSISLFPRLYSLTDDWVCSLISYQQEGCYTRSVTVHITIVFCFSWCPKYLQTIIFHLLRSTTSNICHSPARNILHLRYSRIRLSLVCYVFHILVSVSYFHRLIVSFPINKLRPLLICILKTRGAIIIIILYISIY